MLGFFLLSPGSNKYNAKDCKWINFPWKMNIFIKDFIDYDMGMYNRISQDLVLLLKVFTFGSDEYLRDQRTRLEENLKGVGRRSNKRSSTDNPFWKRPKFKMTRLLKD